LALLYQPFKALYSYDILLLSSLSKSQVKQNIGEAMETQDQDIMVGIRLELYQQIKIVAAQKDLSIREYLEEVLKGIMSRETSASQEQGRPMTHETFEELRQLRERIKRNHPGQTFEDSTELIRQMREERSQYLADL
jgi:uncharacterized protein YaaR (DUF327 family)